MTRVFLNVKYECTIIANLLGIKMKNFIVVGTQRTGSSALAELIGAHEKMVCGWEWTVRTNYIKKIRTAEQALSGNFDSLARKHRDYMTSVFESNTECLGYRQLFRSSHKWLWHPRYSPALYIDRLNAFKDWISGYTKLHVIHIVRKDNIAWLTSKSISNQTGKYTGEYQFDGKTYINVEESIKRLKSKEWVDEQLAELSTTNPYHRVYYEDFKANNQEEVQKVYKFLGYDENDANLGAAKLKIQSKRSVTESVANYNDLKNALLKHRLIDSKI